ncbi:hypothetical protein [Nocardiopsis akebiae]|uniref:hypothetical protein n=1 Tax=Nocardiopsis akebiae TaxID=2831968 RepID=UPI00201600A8|nr:hypothetical protein [Nocardiopsis akebiae]
MVDRTDHDQRQGLGDRALTVFRENLEAALYGAVRGSAAFRSGTTAVDVDQDADGVRVGLSDGTAERADPSSSYFGSVSQISADRWSRVRAPRFRVLPGQRCRFPHVSP